MPNMLPESQTMLRFAGSSRSSSSASDLASIVRGVFMAWKSSARSKPAGQRAFSSLRIAMAACGRAVAASPAVFSCRAPKHRTPAASTIVTSSAVSSLISPNTHSTPRSLMSVASAS